MNTSQLPSPGPRCPPRIRLAAALVSLATFAPWISACSRPPAADLDELSLARQAEAVRSGRSNQVRLDHTLVADADLEQLDGLEEKLERVNLSHTTLTDAGLARLCRFRRLEQLRLASRGISDEGLDGLEQLSRLRYLHLIDAPISDVGLDRLQALTTLESLYLDGAKLTDERIDRYIEARPRVHLHIDGGHHSTDPHALDHEHDPPPQSQDSRPGALKTSGALCGG